MKSIQKRMETKNTITYHFLILMATLSLCQVNSSYAQNTPYRIQNKSISFENKAIDVPQVYSIKGENKVNVAAVNGKIIERFALIPNAPENEADYDAFVNKLKFFEDFPGYLDIKYSYKIMSDFVEINIEGNYVEFEGKPSFEIYQTYKKETFYLEIDKNRLFEASGYDNEIELKYFFEPKEYIEILSKTWVSKIEQIKKKYPEDIDYEYACEDCSSPNAYLHSFAYEHKIEGDSLYFFLNSVAYFRDFCYRNFCSPQLKVAYPIKDVTPLFKKEFDLFKYNELDRLSKIVFYKENLENNLNASRIISGKINGKYPFLMVLNIEEENNIKGHYMYTSNHKFLELRGRLTETNLEIIEYLNNESTGKFQLEYKGSLKSQYDVKKFMWFSPDGNKSYEVEVEDFEIY